MRIRTIKPDFFKHDKISDLAPLTRLLFISLWCMADRRGRLEDRPKRIKVECLPYDECDVDALLWELHNAGFIDRYEAEGMHLIEISSFEKHQRITGKEAESESDYPEKQPGNTRGATCVFPVVQERKGKEGKGKEDGKARQAAPASPTEQEWGEHCTQTYPDWHPICIAESWAYYESVKWRTRAGPIKDWKRAAVTAHGNARQWNKLQPGQRQGSSWNQQPQKPLSFTPGDLDGIDMEDVAKL